MKSDLLKALALKAKNRLINRNNRSYNNETTKIKIISADDKDFEQKVRSLLQNEEFNLSPMKFLMDENKLMKLDSIGRERYLFETIDKFNKVKNQIEKNNIIC